MALKYTHPRNILVRTIQRLYDYGMTTTSGGNLSIKDDDGNIWITPGGIDKGSLRADDIVKVTPSGEIIGRHRPSCELPFHRSVYALRDDVKAVLHAHSPALVAFSLTSRMPDPTLIPSAARICGKVAFAPYAIPGSEKLGNIIAEEFAKGADSVVMENHGAVMCGESIEQAFARFESLDYVARIQINATSLGKEHELVGHLPKKNWQEFIPNSVSADECELRDELANFRARAYKQRLLFSGSAFLSARVENEDFLISPARFEPMFLDALGMVKIHQGMCEAGKTPSSAAGICQNIYKKCPWVNSIIMTRPPQIMAFSVTGNALDSRTIPESYIMLRDMPLLSAEEYFADPDAVVKLLTPATPVVLIESCGILTTGKSVLEAFDRLEVAEFTAKCVLLAQRLGTLNPINDEQVEDIIVDFKLPRK